MTSNKRNITAVKDTEIAPPLKKLRIGTRKKVIVKTESQRKKTQSALVDELDDAISDGESSGYPAVTNKYLAINEGVLWTEKYRPNLSTLAIHKKKVELIQTWIELPSSVLVLSGPAGSGKTATVESILEHKGIAKLEWENPMFKKIADEHETLISKFHDFLIRGERYPDIIMDSSIEHKRVIVLEDIPNTFSSPGSKESFRRILDQFIHSPRSCFPLIIIVSTTETSDHSQNFTPHTLIGSEILSKCMQIEFNPIAKTYIYKVLLHIVEQESLGMLEPEYISALSESGDIRSAINTLQFHTVGSQQSRCKISRRKKGEKAFLSMENQKLIRCAERDVKVEAFHAFGKIVYNRRDDPEDPEDSPLEFLPEHLSSWTRRKSKVDVEQLLSNLTVDISTFLDGIFENYILSCSTIGDVSSTLESLAQTDFKLSYNSKTIEHLLASCAVRSILLCLPSPVTRLKKSNKLFWPEISRVHKQKDVHLENLDGTQWSTTQKYGGYGWFGGEKVAVTTEKYMIEKEIEEVDDLIEDF